MIARTLSTVNPTCRGVVKLRRGVALGVVKPHFAGANVAKLFILIIGVYQRAISPLLGNVCRFEPSCSRYAVACLESHGAMRGSLLSFVRLCKCHPFHPGGVDLPPKKMNS